MATRVLFAMSRDGLFTKKAAAVNEGGTPTVALFLSALVAVLFIVFGQTIRTSNNGTGVFLRGQLRPVFYFAFCFARREPDKPRPYRAWGYPVTPALALIGSVLFLAGAIWADTQKQRLCVAVAGGELSGVSG